MHVGLVLALFALPAQADDPVQVAANLSDTDIQVGETAVLEILVETRGPDVESFELPDLPSGIEISGTRDYSQLQFSLPGGRRRELRREVILTATAPGNFVIRSATIEVDGSRYRTRPLSLRVSGSPTASVPSTPRTDASAAASDGDDIRLRAWIAPDTAYVGQQVTLHAESMWASDIRTRLRRLPQFVPPDITGFWTEELPEDRSSSRSVGGRRYERNSYRRALFPLSPGTFHLPPARLRYDMRRGFSYNPDPQELVSDSLRVVVLPLPAEGQPDDFTGAVGRFNVEARTEPAQVQAGGAVNLTVEISGEGNIKALPAPVIPRTDGMRAYQPSEETELSTDSTGIRGTKRFSWVLVPESSGTLEIPPIAYAYFDPVDGRYRVARSTTLAVNVGPPPQSGDDAPAGDEPEAARIRLFKAEPGPPARLAWVRSGPFAALQFLPLIAVVLVLWYRRPLPPRPPSVRALRRQRRRELQELHAHAASVDPEFFGRLTSAVHAAIARRTRIPRSRLEPGRIVASLQQAGVSAETATAMRELLGRADELRYRPDPPEAEDQVALLRDAERLLEEIDRQAHPPSAPAGAGMHGATAGLLLLSLGGPLMATTATPGLQSDSDQERFRTATAAVSAGDHERAADAFLDYVSRVPGDAHGWYNLGNAAYLAGHPGTAIWAWLRAARIAPRDGDTRHNLRLAGVPADVVRRNTSLIPLSTDEALLLASLAWFLGAIALILYALQDRRAAGPIGVGAIAIAALLLVSWGVPRVGAPRAIALENETQLRTAPAERAEARLSVEPGTQLKIIERRDRWYRVSARGGTEGWIAAELVGRL